MADYPAELARQHRLADGRTVTIRPVRRDDPERMRVFLAESSGETRYRRFHKWIRMPTDKMLEYMTDIDYDRHLSLVCTVPRDGDEEIVGEAGYVMGDERRSCEFCIMIKDSWQKTGIAGLLMALLIRAAQQRGLERMEGLVLSANLEMLRFTRALGFEAQAVPEDASETRVEKKLQVSPVY
jgi:acetyltransferase